ncbi:hypothetical protein GQ53DRAFT_180803 [Thozetella sp. PMI_491]|nr:hypothetical protein GQ53DRAFT_180803 [Thozetella sp. PMI_491]
MRSIFRKTTLVALLLGLRPTIGSLVLREPKLLSSLDPDPTLQTTVDGSCGNGKTCLGSKWGDCCSAHLYCGKSDDYCGSNCNPAFGTCNGVSGAASQGVSSDSGQVCRTTQTETQTQFETSYQLVKTTYTTTEVSTSTSLETKITTFYDISFTTKVLTVTSVVSSVVAQNTALAPSPTLPGAVANCKEWYRIRDDVVCNQVIEAFGITKDDLREWNPAMSRSEEAKEKDRCTVGDVAKAQQGLCRVPCKELWPGYNLCVGV